MLCSAEPHGGLTLRGHSVFMPFTQATCSSCSGMARSQATCASTKVGWAHVCRGNFKDQGWDPTGLCSSTFDTIKSKIQFNPPAVLLILLMLSRGYRTHSDFLKALTKLNSLLCFPSSLGEGRPEIDIGIATGNGHVDIIGILTLHHRVGRLSILNTVFRGQQLVPWVRYDGFMSKHERVVFSHRLWAWNLKVLPDSDPVAFMCFRGILTSIYIPKSYITVTLPFVWHIVPFSLWNEKLVGNHMAGFLAFAQGHLIRPQVEDTTASAKWPFIRKLWFRHL